MDLNSSHNNSDVEDNETKKIKIEHDQMMKWVRIKEYFARFSSVAAAGIAALVVSGTGEKVFNYFNPAVKVETLDSRIKSLTNSLNNAAKNISDIEREVEQRKSLAEKLKADADEAQKIATLNAEQVAAVAQALRGQLKEESRDSFWSGIGMNAFWAIFGALSGEGIRLLRSFFAKRKI